MEDLKQDVSELKQDVKELLKLSAVHNELLRTHEARSLALQKSQEMLESQLDPIKEHVSLMNKLLKGAGLILVGAVVQAIVYFFFKH